MSNQSYNLAEKYFTLAHDKGYIAATYQLGVIHEQGFAGKVDLIQAVRLFKQAAHAGDLDAICKFGELFLLGLNDNEIKLISASFDDAKKCFTKAADQGHAKSALLLTRWFSPGKEYEDKFYKVERYSGGVWRRFFSPTHPQLVTNERWYFPIAMTNWGAYKEEREEQDERGNSTMFPRGLDHVYRANQTELYRYAQLAADGGIAEACHLLGELLSFKHDGARFTDYIFESDLDDAERKLKMEENFKKAADLGYVGGAILLKQKNS